MIRSLLRLRSLRWYLSHEAGMVQRAVPPDIDTAMLRNERAARSGTAQIALDILDGKVKVKRAP